MKLITEWKSFYKFYSIQAKALSAGILIFWNEMPADLKGAIPSSYVIWLAVSILVIGSVGTVIQQFEGEKDVGTIETPVA